jgi:hypothetical protein
MGNILCAKSDPYLEGLETTHSSIIETPEGSGAYVRYSMLGRGNF